MSKLRISEIIQESVVDGPGIRLVIFTQGCFHNCMDCHNIRTHDPDGGFEIDVNEILQMIDKNPLLDGVTISGGEPLLSRNHIPLLELLPEIKKRNLDVMLYTGYEWEDNYMDNCIDILELIDWSVVGPFRAQEKSEQKAFRGSLNQRIIDNKKSFDNKKAVFADFN